MSLNKALMPSLAVFAVSGSLFWGCGKWQSRDEKVIVARSEVTASSTGLNDWEQGCRQVGQYWALFDDSDQGLSRDQIVNLLGGAKDLFNKLKDHFEDQALTIEELADMIMQLDHTKNNRVTLSEMSEAVTQRLPNLKLTASEHPSSYLEMLDSLNKKYPGASLAAKKGLVDTLVLFDEPWAGGNSNKKIDFKEIALEQVAIGGIDQLDFSSKKPDLFKRVKRDDQKNLELGFEQLERKVTQQMLGRYEIAGARNLSPVDYKLEVMQLTLRVMLIDRLVRNHSVDSKIPESSAHKVLSMYSRHLESWLFLRKIYDSSLMLGTKDGAYNSFETIGLLTDLDHQYALARVLGDSKLDHSTVRGKSFVLKHLVETFPSVGRDLFLEDDRNAPIGSRQPRKSYWDSLLEFDAPEKGGNGDKRLDEGERAVAFAYVILLDGIFARYDSDKDGMITKSEFKLLSEELFQTNNKLAATLFFSDWLDLNDWKHEQVIKAVLAALREKSIDSLTPYEFYQRMAKHIPVLVNK